MTRNSPTSLQPPPAGLADVLNPAEEQRDSAYFSSSSNGDASKHNSIVSNTPGLITPSGYSSTADMTPSPINTGMPPQSLASPTSSSMTVASMVSPTTPSSMDQSMLAKLNPRNPDNSQRSSILSNADSRRESVESRINVGFEGMRLHGNSPYASHNPSTTSIQSSLQQQRNPGNPGVVPDRLSGPRLSNTYQVSSQRHLNRQAPAITGPATRAVANAAEPTEGQPWAFPDEPSHIISLAQSEHESGQVSFVDSRRSSIAESFASSQFTQESRFTGQRRLEDGYAPDQRHSRASSELQLQGVSHHHHSLQNRVSELREGDAGSPGGGAQPYSRTPELRKSHKLAERKRRNEMKSLYDELRDLMPQERGSKASKWEILSRAITEHKRQEDTIRGLENHYRQTQMELMRTRDETNELRHELRALRAQVNGAFPAPAHSQAHPQAPPPPPSQPMEGYMPDHYRGHTRQESRPDVGLPSIRHISAPSAPMAPSYAPPEAMSGVQYHHEQNGYRGEYTPRI